MSENLEAKFRVHVEGKDELANFFGSGERGATSFQRAIKGALGDVAKSIEGFTKGLARDLMNVSGIKLGIAGNAKSTLEWRDAVTQLAVSANLGDNEIGNLKKQILDTAAASNQLSTDVTAALQAFVEQTGDIDTARKNLDLYAKTATAARASMEEIASVGVEMKEKMNVSDQARSFALLVAQAKAGRIEVKDMARQFPRVLNAASFAGMTGEQGVAQSGALFQVYAKAFSRFGGPASAATSFENTFRDIRKKAPQLEKAGLKVTGRDPVEVLFDIIRRTGGNAQALGKIFDIRAERGVALLANEYRKTGGFGTYEKFLHTKADPGLIAADFARQSSTGMAALRRTQEKVFRASEENLGDTAESLAKHSGGLADLFGFGTAHPLLAAGAGAAGLFGLGLGKRALFGGGGAGGIAGKLLGGAGMPVMVTNWPATLGGGLPGVNQPGGKTSWLGFAGAAGSLLLLTKELSDRFGGSKEMERRTGRAAPTLSEGLSALKQTFHIHINGDKATVEQEHGTRSPEVIVRRGGAN